MKEYKIKRVKEKDFLNIDSVNIDNLLWGGTYKPECLAKVIYVEDKGFYARLYAKETAPLMTYKTGEFSDDVCDDSCLEWFIDFVPGNEKGYINFEANACAAMNCGLGTGRNDRVPIHEIIGVKPELSSGREGDFWYVEYYLSLDILEKLYGEINTQSGAEYRGNFYKCGELTDNPSYLSWSFIDLPNPDFHCPQFFGKLVLE